MPSMLFLMSALFECDVKLLQTLSGGLMVMSFFWRGGIRIFLGFN